MITKLSCCLQENITLLSGFNYFCLEICQSCCSSFKQNVSCSTGFFQGSSHYSQCPTFAVMICIYPVTISLDFFNVFIYAISILSSLHTIFHQKCVVFLYLFIFLFQVFDIFSVLDALDVILFTFL